MTALISLVRDFFSEFSRLKLFLLVFFASLIAILLSLKIGGFAATAVVLVPAILSILQITKGVWTPEGGGKSTLGLASLAVALLAVATNHAWRPLAEPLLEPVFSKYPTLKDHLPTDSPSILGLIFLAAVILIVNLLARDKTAMKEHPTPVEKEFPEREYKALVKHFCGILRDDLDRVDRETNWSAEIFTPLDAEVELQTGNRRIKKVADLLTAIKSDRTSRVFLVLGDPGSGKSVSLRKLCRDLLQEVESSGRVPIYLNLREWERKELWTEENPPTVEQLNEFVFTNLADRGDVFTREFLNKYYLKMFQNGRLFIVLDSFDEIPAVLDVDENSWLIDELSQVMFKFLAGAHDSRGILASRMFRRPTAAFNAKAVLALRPFTEMKIVEMLRKSLFYDEALVQLLFNERQEFISLARNPFTAALIASYAKEHGNTLPETQSDLYSSYIEYRLQACKDKIESKRLTNDEIVNCSVDIAHVMLTTKTGGLEASVQQLQQSLPHQAITDVIDILRYARLARLGSGDRPRFSFAHRRFNEYFVVKRLQENPDQAPITDIPTDSRWRDALVLYAEVADPSKAAQIAAYCWSEVRQLSTVSMSDPGYLKAVHCLRFLKDAFRARLDSIRAFRSALAELIRKELVEGENLVSKKIAVEAVGLVDPDNMKDIVGLALAYKSAWINEVALRSCHYLPEASSDLKRELRFFIDRLSFVSFMKRRRELILSLTLSNVFRSVRLHCYWRLVDMSACFIAVIIFFIWQPVAGLILIIFCLTLLWLDSKAEVRSRSVYGNFFYLFLLPLILCLYAWVFFVETYLNWVSDYKHFGLLFGVGTVSLFTLPWYRAIHYLPELVRFKVSRKRAVESAALLVAYLVVGIVSIKYLSETVANWFLVVVGSVGGIIALAGVCVWFARMAIDYRSIIKLSHAPLSTRAAVAHEINKMKTGFGRVRFVRSLNERKSPTGSWPNGELPNFGDDRASTLLAQLEERWLGLDR